VTGGGVIPREDIAVLRKRGVGELFEPGTPLEEFVGYIQEEVARRRSSRAGSS
jgi:methylmalonyl-CoA mutase C-terminal domain/subunit